MVNELRLKFKVITPLFMGGADKRAELRPPSFKGLLRFWYRAADPKFNDPWDADRMKGSRRESVFWGSSANGSGQAPFILQVDSDAPGIFRWDKSWAAKFDVGKGKNTRNGLVYLGYPFHMGERRSTMGQQTAIAPGHEFSMRCILPRGEVKGLRQVLVSSWWLFAHLGGAGSRGRRGFGNLVLKDWATTGENWPELSMLPLLYRSASLDDFAVGLNRAFQTIGGWFGGFSDSAAHPHLGHKMRVKFLDQHFPSEGWAAALDCMGRKLQDFRTGSAPDCGDVREHLVAKKNRGGRYLQQAPSRATFGLPLAFRFGVNLGSATFVPFDPDLNVALERHASLLHLRLAPIGDRLYPFFIRLDGNVPGFDPPGAVRGQRTALRSPKENAMDRFMEQL
jgi:CRISPR-associated protein Cmr1